MTVGTGALELSEAQIARTCSDLLQADGWRMLITDPVSDTSTVAAIRRALMAEPALRMVRDIINAIMKSCTRGKGFGEVGMADRLYIRYGWPPDQPGKYSGAALVMWIEWKRIRGKVATKATTEQWEWHQHERALGALTFIAGVDFPATIEGFIQWYRNSGLHRGR